MKNSLLPFFIFCSICFALGNCTAMQKSAKKAAAPQSSISKEDKLRNDIVTFAKKHVGTHYKVAGKTEGGFDCSGFVFYVMNKHGIALPGSSATQETYGKHIDPSDAKAGDLIFFRRKKKGRVFHVAIVYSNDHDGIQVVHSTSKRGVVFDNLKNSTYWFPKISTARSVVE